MFEANPPAQIRPAEELRVTETAASAPWSEDAICPTLQAAEEMAMNSFRERDIRPKDNLEALRALAKSYHSLESDASRDIAIEIELGVIVQGISLARTYLKSNETHLALEALLLAFTDYKSVHQVSKEKRAEIISGFKSIAEDLINQDTEGEFDSAVGEIYEAMHDHTSSLGADVPSGLLWLTSLGMADLALHQERFNDCLAWCEEAHKNLDSAPEHDDLRALIFCRITEAHIGLGDFLSAVSSSEEAVRLVSGRFEDDPDLLLAVYQTAAAAHKEGSDLDSAKECLQIAARQLQVAGYEERESSIKLLGNLAALYLETGETEQYLETLITAANLAKDHLGQAHPTSIELLSELATYYQDNEQEEEAFEILDGLKEATKTAYGENSTEHIQILLDLADTAYSFGLNDTQAGFLDTALSRSAGLTEEDRPLQVEILGRMGYLLLTLGDAAAGEIYHNEAVTLAEQFFDRHPLRLTEALANRSSFLDDMKGPKDALPDALRAYELLIDLDEVHPSAIAEQAFDIGELYVGMEAWDEAKKFYQIASQYFDRAGETAHEIAITAKLKFATLNLQQLSEFANGKEKNRAINSGIRAINDTLGTGMEDSFEVLSLLQSLDDVIPEYDERRITLRIEEKIGRLQSMYTEEGLEEEEG